MSRHRFDDTERFGERLDAGQRQYRTVCKLRDQETNTYLEQAFGLEPTPSTEPEAP